MDNANLILFMVSYHISRCLSKMSPRRGEVHIALRRAPTGSGVDAVSKVPMMWKMEEMPFTPLDVYHDSDTTTPIVNITFDSRERSYTQDVALISGIFLFVLLFFIVVYVIYSEMEHLKEDERVERRRRKQPLGEDIYSEFRPSPTYGSSQASTQRQLYQFRTLPAHPCQVVNALADGGKQPAEVRCEQKKQPEHPDSDKKLISPLHGSSDSDVCFNGQLGVKDVYNNADVVIQKA
ncbi:hypothetical protein Q1695_013347 [Nippostrongylus brasiliensis]|nr:hypothetical protein Q1695_013347 [Nippostrongylus brasiliensis]